MILLGLRLAVNGGREAITRLVVLAVAVGLGVGLLLTAVAATNAVTSWNNRHAWFWTGTAWVPPGPAAGIAPLWWHPGGDIFDGQQINRFDVAATGTSSPVPPGIPRDPGPGQYYASPALAALLRSTPADQLADRYPGRLAGVIGDAALPSPGSLVIIIGRTPAQLAHTPDSVQVTSISTTEMGWPLPRTEVNPKGLTYTPADPGGGASSTDLILSVVALAILAPVLIFIATATRLSAARREERFAAMRLAGATRRQVSLLAATESTAAALLGVAAGFGIFFLLRIPVAGIPFIGQPFFPGELTLSLPDILAVAIGVPVFAAVAARLALRRVNISPLGVARRATPKPPRAWRVVPLLAGLAELGFWTIHGHPASIPGQIQAFFSSFALIIVGLFIAGPWLTMAAARAMARWTSRPGTLIAARRLADDPRAAFRAVSGLVLALFITTVAVVAIATQNAKNLTRWSSAAEANVLTNQVSASSQVAGSNGPGASQSTAAPGPAAPAAPLVARLRGIPGVQGVLVVRADPRLTIRAAFHNLGANSAGRLVGCRYLAGQHVRLGGAAPPGGVLGGLRGDGDHGHGGDEQCEDQAADGAEGGPRVIGEAAGGDQRAGAAGPPGHGAGRGHGEPRAGDEQADEDEREAGHERLDLSAYGGRVAAHGPEAEFGQAGQQRHHPPGPRRLRRGPAGDAERGDVDPVQRQPGRYGGEDGHADRDREDVRHTERQFAGEERLAEERDARDRGAQQEEDPEPGGHPEGSGHGRFGGGEQGDLLAGRADQAHRREPLFTAGGRQPGRGGDEDKDRGQDGQRHDGQDKVGGALRGACVGRRVGQASGVGLDRVDEVAPRYRRGNRRHRHAIRGVRQLRRGAADDDDQRVRRRQGGVADRAGQVAGVAVGELVRRGGPQQRG